VAHFLFLKTEQQMIGQGNSLATPVFHGWLIDTKRVQRRFE
jgi:hypothetical protein